MALRLAFTGTGYISRIHARAAQNSGAQLAAVVNHKPDSMQKFAADFGIPRQYSNLTDLLKDGGVEAVVVSTPNYLHAPETIAALNAGLHVMVEKPMSLNAAEAKAMTEASEQSGKLLMIAHCWRFDPEVNWLRNQVKAGKLGTIIRTKGCGVHVNWGPSGHFAEKRFAGGGAMADMGVHALDTARFLLGDPQPTSVYARIGTYYKDFDVDDTGIVIVNWDNGASSYFESGWWQPHADGPNAYTQLYGKEGFGQLFPAMLKMGDQVEQSGFTAPRPSHMPQSMYDAQLAYFLKCIQENQKPTPGGADGWTNMKVVDAAYESARTGQAINVA